MLLRDHYYSANKWRTVEIKKFSIGAGTTPFLCFSRAIVFLRPQYLVQTFHWDKTPRSTTAYTDVSCLHCPRQLSRYSSPTCCQLLLRCHLNLTVSTSQHSMWWHCQCLMCLLAFYDQFIKDYRRSQVSAHWCFFYERTCEREMGYKWLMTVCWRNLQML